MDREELESSILRDLVRLRTKNDIVTKLCETTGMRWEEAERLVTEIESNHADEISSRQKPLLYILGFVIAVGGLAASVMILAFALDGQYISLGWRPFSYLDVPYLGSVFFFGIGIATMIGGIVGILKLRRTKNDDETMSNDASKKPTGAPKAK